MIMRGMTGLSILAACLLGGCIAIPSERVLLREPSPDGRLDAVLMQCRSRASTGRLELVGGVFPRTGGRSPDCGDRGPTQAWFVVSSHQTPPEAVETVEWRDGRAVFNLPRRLLLTHSGRIEDVMEVHTLPWPARTE